MGLEHVLSTRFTNLKEVSVPVIAVNHSPADRAIPRARRGVAAVEFALIAPLFVLLLFGMIEFGRMVMVQQMLTNASREGARIAVIDGTTPQQARDIVKSYLATTVAVADESITVTPDPQTAAFGDPIEVSITIPFTDVSWLPSPMFLPDAELTATTVMRRESTP